MWFLNVLHRDILSFPGSQQQQHFLSLIKINLLIIAVVLLHTEEVTGNVYVDSIYLYLGFKSVSLVFLISYFGF